MISVVCKCTLFWDGCRWHWWSSCCQRQCHQLITKFLSVDSFNYPFASSTIHKLVNKLIDWLLNFTQSIRWCITIDTHTHTHKKVTRGLNAEKTILRTHIDKNLIAFSYFKMFIFLLFFILNSSFAIPFSLCLILLPIWLFKYTNFHLWWNSCAHYIWKKNKEDINTYVYNHNDRIIWYIGCLKYFVIATA